MRSGVGKGADAKTVNRGLDLAVSRVNIKVIIRLRELGYGIVNILIDYLWWSVVPPGLCQPATPLYPKPAGRRPRAGNGLRNIKSSCMKSVHPTCDSIAGLRHHMGAFFLGYIIGKDLSHTPIKSLNL